MKNEVIKYAKEIEGELIGFRHKIHSYAEVGFDLPKTTKLVSEAISAMGGSTKRLGRCGLIAELGQGKCPTVLLRADMDALKIRERTGLPFAAKNGNMHACGHDIHTSMLLGAFYILSKLQDKIRGRIKFVFQPAEETLEGCADMIEGGLLDEKIDMALAIHVLSGTELPCGTFIVPEGGVSAPSSTFFKITVRGTSAHGGMHTDGRDALACAARILQSIEELPCREFNSKDPVAVTVGTFNGGNAPNVIADLCELCGTARATSRETGKRLFLRITELSSGIARLYGCRAKAEILSFCPPLVNDGTCSERIAKYARELFGNDRVLSSAAARGASGGSEDFAFIAERVPSCAVAISAGSIAEGHSAPLHNPETILSDDSIRHGAAYLAFSALRYFDEMR